MRLFRPQKHVDRMNLSARRLCIPELDPELGLQSLVDLVRLEEAWVPSSVGTALYIRPTIIANEPFLGVRPAKQYLYFVILSPVGAYYKEGMNPVKIRVEDKYVRAVEGGTGGAKTGANYAASLLAAEEAHHAGFTQVLWLDGAQRKYVDEVGTMNIMMRIGDEVLTPAAHHQHDPARRDARLRAHAPPGVGRPRLGAADRHRRGAPGGAPRARCGRSGAPGPPPSSRRSGSWPTRASASSSGTAASAS